MIEEEKRNILSGACINACEFCLPDSLTIENAEAVSEVFKSMPVFDGMRLELNASKVDFITAPGMQLILALKNSITKNNGELFVKSPSNAFVSSAEDMGMLERLNIISEA